MYLLNVNIIDLDYYMIYNKCMKKIIAFFVFLIGCSSVYSQSCDLCGNWSFDKFEYVGHITTDCEGDKFLGLFSWFINCTPIGHIIL